MISFFSFYGPITYISQHEHLSAEPVSLSHEPLLLSASATRRWEGKSPSRRNHSTSTTARRKAYKRKWVLVSSLVVDFFYFEDVPNNYGTDVTNVWSYHLWLWLSVSHTLTVSFHLIADLCYRLQFLKVLQFGNITYLSRHSTKPVVVGFYVPTRYECT
jgi:hypothetical protein